MTATITQIPVARKRGPSPTKTDCAKCEATIQVGDPVAVRDTGRTIQYVCKACDGR